MPVPKGSKLDPKTGKFKPPPGYKKKHSNDGQAAKPAPVSRSQKIERGLDLIRQTARQAFSYKLFALYPDERAYLATVEEPSFESIAQNWGGGRYEVWKMDRTTGEAVGDPYIMTVDRLVYPVKLPRFSASGPPAAPSPWGQPGSTNPWGQGIQFPGGYPPSPYAGGPPGVGTEKLKIAELEEELEEAEDEIENLKAQLTRERNERENDKREAERQLEAASRKEEMRSLIEAVTGGANKKDPIELFMSLKRMEAELAGPLKTGQNPMEAMQAQLGFVTMFLDLAKKLAPKSEDEGSGLAGFLGVAGKLLENRQSAPAEVIQLPAAPAVKVKVEPSPEEIEKKAEQEKDRKVFEVKMRWVFSKVAGKVRELPEDAGPEVLGDFILTSTGDGFSEFRDIIKTDNPENAVQVFQDIPELNDVVATEEGKKMIAAAFAYAQQKLIEA